MAAPKHLFFVLVSTILCGVSAFQQSNVLRLSVSVRSSTLESDITVAFQKVKDAAALFPQGSEERSTAEKIIKKLSGAHFDTWKADDMELLDSCLVDESQEACVEFVRAMTDLRELHEGSPGNA